jgi:hypothetical protein
MLLWCRAICSTKTSRAPNCKLPYPCIPTPQREKECRHGHVILRRGLTGGTQSPCTGQPIQPRTNSPLPLFSPAADSAGLQHLAPTSQDFILHHASAANSQIVLDSCQEPSHESKEWVWRHWLGYCDQAGLQTDQLLSSLSEQERELVIWSFFSLYHEAKWSPTGRLLGKRFHPMVVSTLRAAAGNLAAFQWEPCTNHAPQRRPTGTYTIQSHLPWITRLSTVSSSSFLFALPTILWTCTNGESITIV